MLGINVVSLYSASGFLFYVATIDQGRHHSDLRPVSLSQLQAPHRTFFRMNWGGENRRKSPEFILSLSLNPHAETDLYIYIPLGDQHFNIHLTSHTPLNRERVRLNSLLFSLCNLQGNCLLFDFMDLKTIPETPMYNCGFSVQH